ncbi:MAG TPA: hypothetical protein VGY96_06750 [Streptosporangiaceae bacterium]|nr:hypothetical protein [Streptosporangiaceae bacterium]
MPDKITYYAIIGEDRTIDNPYGLARRLEHDDGPSDEALRKDFSWKFTPVIVEWERGDFADELIEVSHEQASKIIEYFRQKWGLYGQPLDS